MSLRLIAKYLLAAFSLSALLLGLFRPAHAESIERLDDASGGAIESVRAVYVAGKVVTAVRTGEGELKVIAWSLSDSGSLARLGEATAGAIGPDYDIAATGANAVVTAVADAAGELKLIEWSMSRNGSQINRGWEASAGAVDQIELERVNGNMVISAVSDGAGNLKLIAWDAGSGERMGDAGAGAVSRIAMSRAGNCGGSPYVSDSNLVTAVRDAAGELKLISWCSYGQGQVAGTIVRKSDVSAGAVSEFDLVYHDLEALYPASAKVLTTPVRDSAGEMRVIVWHLGTDYAQFFSRIGHAQAGAIGAVSGASLPSPGAFDDRLVTAVSDGDGNLKVISWVLVALPAPPIRHLDESAGTIGSVAAVAAPGSGLFVTALRDGTGNLKLISWRHPL